MEKFTLEEIEAATSSTLMIAKDDEWYGWFWESVKEELTRPKPEFAIGQLLAHQRNDFECLRVSANDGMKYLNYRPLTQQEVGPNWVPKEPVKALRAWVDWVAAQGSLLERQRAPYEDVLRAAPLRLAAFDAAMGDES